MGLWLVWMVFDVSLMRSVSPGFARRSLEDPRRGHASHCDRGLRLHPWLSPSYGADAMCRD